MQKGGLEVLVKRQEEGVVGGGERVWCQMHFDEKAREERGCREGARHLCGTLYPLPVIALGSQLIIMPWLQALHTVEALTINHAALSYSPFDLLFSKTSRRDKSASLVLHLQFICRVFASSVPDAALFIDCGLSTNSGSTIYPHIFLPFFGGPDGHLALSFVVQLCMYGAISATIMCICQLDSNGKELLPSAGEKSIPNNKVSLLSSFMMSN